MNYPHSVSIERSALVGTKYVFSTVGSSAAFIQPIKAEEVQLFGIAYAKGFGCYMPFGTDILVGDRIIYNTETYGVKGVSSYPYHTGLDHKKVMLEKL